MSENRIKTRIAHKVNTLRNWESAQLSGVVLFNGEIAFVRNEDNGTVGLKIGDGTSPFANLPYVQSPALSGKQDILVGTTAEWLSQPGFAPRKGQIVVWSDHGTVTQPGEEEGSVVSVDVPGFKVGDGNFYNIDLPFVGDDVVASMMEALAQHARSDSHLSAGERESWNHKITLGSAVDPNDDGIDGEILVITRN